MLPLGLLVTQTGHAPVSGMTNITYVVCPGHFLCCSVSEWPTPGHGAGSGEELVAEVISDAGDVSRVSGSAIARACAKQKGCPCGPNAHLRRAA